MAHVNLDALIPREDLEVKDVKQSTNIHNISISNLEDSNFFRATLRKPEFQRETLEWTPDRVYGLIQSFVDGHLVPAIILWQGDGNIFVIDGSHRLSALIAWVSDDYGDKRKSKELFGEIPTNQAKLADDTRKLVEKNIGSYKDIQHAMTHQEGANPEHLKIGKKLSSLAITLQWVPGDASQAEKSFFKINESASPLDVTEKRLLFSRKKPSGIASRAIIRSGSGHKYWDKFAVDVQDRIEKNAKAINGWLFNPQLETPVKTQDIPIAGKSHSQITRELVLNIVNFSNSFKIVDKSSIKKTEDFPESKQEADIDGKITSEYLENTKKILANITGAQSSSLGLHPVIYFYARNGRYQITSFMAILDLITQYERGKKLEKFTTVRKKFEEFLWKYKIIVNQSAPEWGSGAKGYINLKKTFDFIIEQLLSDKTEEEIIIALDNSIEFNFLKPNAKPRRPKARKDFSGESKSEVFLTQAMESALRCEICGGFLHKNSISIDHHQDIKSAGIGSPDNGVLTHPYCNSIKDNLIRRGFYKPEKAIIV